MQYVYEFQGRKQFYGFSYQTHKKGKTEQIEIPILKRDRKFLRNKKEELLSFCKLKKLTSKDLESFYWKNHNKLIYLIDKSENKNGNVFLRKVNLFSNYRTFQ